MSQNNKKVRLSAGASNSALDDDDDKVGKRKPDATDIVTKLYHPWKTGDAPVEGSLWVRALSSDRLC